MSNHGLRELNAVCLCTSYRLPSPLGNPSFEGKKVYKTKQKIHFRNQHQPFAFLCENCKCIQNMHLYSLLCTCLFVAKVTAESTHLD